MDNGARGLILLVEDETDLASTCERLLTRRGHQVVPVGSRAAALDALRVSPPALIVADVFLPDGNGLDVVRAASGMKPTIPAVVMTARASEAGRVAARAAGALAYLVKPFTAEAFASLVDRVLTRGAA